MSDAPEKTNGEDMEFNPLIDKDNIPSHVGIIMDGNGRWAQKMGKLRTIGHRRGTETVRTAITYCSEIGVKALSLFAFSTENWKRSEQEIATIMSLLVEYLAKETQEMKENNVVLKFIGDIDRLPQKSRQSIAFAENETKDNDGLCVNIAINYGGRAEITRACRMICEAVSSEKIRTIDINEELFSKYLYTPEFSQLDLLIRTGAEKRISNFLLWQVAYAEIYFTDVLWPDFNDSVLDKAILFFQNRQRRYGGVV